MVLDEEQTWLLDTAGLMGENFILSLPGTSKLELSRPSA
jgi:hypothetical protein